MKFLFFAILISGFIGCSNQEKTLPIFKILRQEKKDSSTYILQASLTNPNQDTLIIIDFSVGCTCTNLDLPKGTKIPGKDSISIELTVKTDKKKTVEGVFKTNGTPILLPFSFQAGE